MRTARMLGIFLLVIFGFALHAENTDITGFWQTIDKETKRPNSVIVIYPYQGKYYGRMLGTYNEQGILDDTIYNPIGRAPGVAGNPYYSGLDFIFDVVPLADDDEDDDDDDYDDPRAKGRYKGRIMDPRSGKTYRAKLWKKDGNLILRGEVFIFGKNITWPPFPEKGFNKNFKKPDIKKFVPVIPQPAH
jgi:hypothetical protein